MRKEWKQVLKFCLTTRNSYPKKLVKVKWCLKTAFFNKVYIENKQGNKQEKKKSFLKMKESMYTQPSV